jgi:hypothetical protein
MQYLTLVIMGLTNILVVGLFFFYIFKRKISLATYVEKVHFYSNLILLLMTLHYLNLITPYLSESLLFHSLTFSPAILIPNVGALLFWTLLIYVVKKVLLSRAESKISTQNSVITQKSPTNLKVIGLTLLPVFAIAIYFSYPIIAAKFSNSIKVKTSCGEIYSIDEYSVNTERAEVVRIQKVFDEKKELAASSIVMLKDCTVLNSKNWTCGGKYFYGNRDAIEKVIDGKFEYISRSTEDKRLIPCKIEQLN